MLNDFKKGAGANIPLAMSAIVYGGVLGVLSAQQQVSWAEMMAMNLFMFAGSAQFVAVEMWQAPLPVWEIVLAVFVINLRYLLIGASLQPLFQSTRLAGKVAMIHFVADENWAVTMSEHRKREVTPFFLLGGGVLLLCAWSMGTLSGNMMGEFIVHPEKYALDFAFVAVFAALALSVWRGKTDIIPWLVAAVLAILMEWLVPGKWYVVAGGVGGSLTAALINKE